MLRSYLKIAVRNWLKREGYSSISFAGLSIGIAVAILISLYAYHELTYDRFHKNADVLYLVYKERITPAGTHNTYETWFPLKKELEETYPGVVRAARTFTQKIWMEAEGKRFRENVVYTDPELFEMFTFPLVKGDNEKPFPSLQSVVISEELARKYFGTEDPIGKVFRLAYERDYVVSGVLKEIPQNSSIRIDMAIQLEKVRGYENGKENWSNSFLNTYIQLREDVTASELENQFPAFITKIWDEKAASGMNIRLLPVPEMHNRFNDSNKYAYILLGIAFAIGVIACIHFMNMVADRSMKRIREAGIRKALEGQRSQLVLQFLGESVLIKVLMLWAGIGLAKLMLAVFNKLYGLNLTLALFDNSMVLPGLTGFGLIIGLIAGSYPALFLSQLSSAKGSLNQMLLGEQFQRQNRICNITKDERKKRLNLLNIELFSQLFQNSPVGMVMLNESHKIRGINQSFEQMFGYKLTEIKNKKIDDLLIPGDKYSEAYEITERTFRGDSYQTESVRITKGGKEVPVLIGTVPVTLEEETIAIFGIYVDISERKMTEAKLRQSLEEREELIKELHHRVKNNLAIITSLLELQKHQTGDPKVQQELQESQSRIHSMALVHEQLYQMGTFSSLQLDEYIENLGNAIHSKFGEKSTDIKIIFHTEPVQLVLSQAVSCGMLLNELITNAFRHAFKEKKEGMIRISLCQSDEQVVLNVTDNGSGLPDELIEGASESLGMTLIHTCTRQLKGELCVENINGASFTIRFPVKARTYN